jgi:hypothetical protein
MLYLPLLSQPLLLSELFDTLKSSLYFDRNALMLDA